MRITVTYKDDIEVVYDHMVISPNSNDRMLILKKGYKTTTIYIPMIAVKCVVEEQDE